MVDLLRKDGQIDDSRRTKNQRRARKHKHNNKRGKPTRLPVSKECYVARRSEGRLKDIDVRGYRAGGVFLWRDATEAEKQQHDGEHKLAYVLLGREVRVDKRSPDKRMIVVANLLGGKRDDASDECPAHTASREFHEESGLLFGDDFVAALRADCASAFTTTSAKSTDEHPESTTTDNDPNRNEEQEDEQEEVKQATDQLKSLSLSATAANGNHATSVAWIPMAKYALFFYKVTPNKAMVDAPKAYESVAEHAIKEQLSKFTSLHWVPVHEVLETLQSSAARSLIQLGDERRPLMRFVREMLGEYEPLRAELRRLIGC
eukprot:TRINITY_DN102917_c0_g1_i1.p1 TRINITY_DN102917_c0_g1~~TRINITY_DN102917_c0_g1_i1.p1  ORF type:complete len:373 (+),score=179.77 TRINITY_DN102917_c0_g1_i1:166-1119(+)